MDKIAQFLLDFQHVEVFSFQVGYIAGVGVFLALAILVAILYLVFFRYPRKSAGVAIRSSLGDIFIAAHAISDLVKSLESEYKDIEITKVLLLDCKRFNRIEIQVDYALGGENMVDIAPSLQGKTLSSLKEVFGVDNIHDVSVRIRRAVANKSPF
jgi:hypothetical protein